MRAPCTRAVERRRGQLRGLLVLVCGAVAACATDAASGAGGASAAGASGASDARAAGAGASASGTGGLARPAADSSTATLQAGAGGMRAASGAGGVPAASSVGSAGVTGLPAAGSGGQPAAAGGGAPSARKKFVGNITTHGQVRSDFATYWDQITPENEGKWGSVESTRNQMSWAGLDRIHDYAKAHGLAFKQHTMVWGSQQPSWLAGLSEAEQRSEVEQWIKLFCERYPDVALIDVVNEPPPHTMPVYMNALGGAGQSGYDWIVQAFKWTKQYCPNATLILNDYNNIEYAGDNQHFLDIVSSIQKAGAPIDALGAQAHDAYKLPTDSVQALLAKLEATGLPVYITEYDLDLADDAEQKMVMQTQFPLFWNDDKVHGITLWGYVVGATWKPNTGLMSDTGAARPALSWLVDYLK